MSVWGVLCVFALGALLGGALVAFAFMTTHYHPEK